MKKTETIQEFLERGGKITVVAPVVPEKKPEPIHRHNNGPAVLLTYEEGDLYYGEGRPPKTTKKAKQPSIDFSALPEPLKQKYLKEYMEANGIEEEEEEDDEEA